MKPTRRQFILGLTAASAVPACGSSALGAPLAPEAFGAKGDGRTNDTAAFAALSAQVNAQGGGTIVLRPVTYIVGAQERTAAGTFAPIDILHFERCAGAILIVGNGARLRAAPDLRFGTFDLQSGRPAPSGLPPREFARRLASPYPGMIYVHDCSGNVEIRDLELDGNIQHLQLGGKYNEHIGWHAQGSGIWFRGHKGPATLSRLHLHHHGLDGITFTDAVDRAGETRMSDVTSEYNGRCAGSITSGRNYLIERCKFLRSGRVRMRNAPACGFDIEAEAATIRNVSFSDCEFSDNSGMAMVAGNGDSDGISFTRCRFVGTDHWAAWPNKPHTKFIECVFVGSIIRPFADADASRAARFVECTFTDDRRLSPSGKVFIDRGSIAVIPDCRNVSFDKCNFRLVEDAKLPLSSGVIYDDCTMSQRTAALSHPNGTYLGRTTITGNADLSGSIVSGVVVLNGQMLPRSG